jgi:hypothetical protein
VALDRRLPRQDRREPEEGDGVARAFDREEPASKDARQIEREAIQVF